MEENSEEAFRDRISTVDDKGGRVWIYAKKPKGRFFNYRKLVSYVLLLLLFGLPHLRIAGEQALLFNVIERKFVIFGKIFWPQDLYIFAIAFIVLVIFVVLFTIIFGRLFCGWVCPQTIFMEMVFRRIEHWIEGDWTHQKKLNSSPWGWNKIWKKSLKHFIFWVISFAIANTFLAYIIGTEELWEIQTDPLGSHVGGFVAILIFTTVFYLVFSLLREQVCTTICPYGRLQGVLLDENSMVVGYDYKRGEGRAKFRKNEDRSAAGKGDCIDCHQCVNVCPTGIDIRNGTQLECVNCTACIDECDHMMEGVGLEKGLIRFVSEKGITEGKRFEWTKRVKAYTFLLLALFATLVVLLLTRNDFQVTVHRQRGTTYFMTEDGNVENIFEINLTNKTRDDYRIELKLDETHGEIKLAVDTLLLKNQGHTKERFVMKIPLQDIDNGKLVTHIVVLGNGKEIERIKVKFIGPLL
jgi:cytochrome c oxidase accessory protein FixG